VSLSKSSNRTDTRRRKGRFASSPLPLLSPSFLCRSFLRPFSWRIIIIPRFFSSPSLLPEQVTHALKRNDHDATTWPQAHEPGAKTLRGKKRRKRKKEKKKEKKKKKEKEKEKEKRKRKRKVKTTQSSSKKRG
jgi:hypothetical protein